MTREEFIARIKNLKTEDEWLAFEDECNEVLTEAIADIFKRMDEIQERLEHERRQRKKLAEQLIER